MWIQAELVGIIHELAGSLHSINRYEPYHAFEKTGISPAFVLKAGERHLDSISEITFMRYVLSLMAIVLVLQAADALFETKSPQDYIDAYNTNIDQAPQILRDLLGSEMVDIEITMRNGTVYRLGLETLDGRIIQSYPGGIDDYTIKIQTSESTIDQVVSSQDHVAAFKEAKNKGDIKIEAAKLTTRLKIALVLASTDVFKYFLNIFFT